MKVIFFLYLYYTTAFPLVNSFRKKILKIFRRGNAAARPAGTRLGSNAGAETESRELKRQRERRSRSFALSSHLSPFFARAGAAGAAIINEKIREVTHAPHSPAPARRKERSRLLRAGGKYALFQFRPAAEGAALLRRLLRRPCLRAQSVCKRSRLCDCLRRLPLPRRVAVLYRAGGVSAARIRAVRPIPPPRGI